MQRCRAVEVQKQRRRNVEVEMQKCRGVDRDEEVQTQRCGERCRYVEIQRCRDAEVSRCRGAEMQRCLDVEVWRYRGVEMQRFRDVQRDVTSTQLHIPNPHTGDSLPIQSVSADRKQYPHKRPTLKALKGIALHDCVSLFICLKH